MTDEPPAADPAPPTNTTFHLTADGASKIAAAATIGSVQFGEGANPDITITLHHRADEPELAPGGKAVFTARIHNHGKTTRTLTLTAPGLPECEIAPFGPVAPGAQIKVVVTVPCTPTAPPAGSFPLVVEAKDLHSPMKWRKPGARRSGYRRHLL